MATSVGMNELNVTLGDRSYRFSPGETVRIGRSPDNDIVVGDPTVSRQHAQMSCGPDGWEWENVGRAMSFLDGQPISRVLLPLPAAVQLASGHGPVLGLQPGAQTQAASGGEADHDHTSVMDENQDWLDQLGFANGDAAASPAGPAGPADPAEAPAPDPLDSGWGTPEAAQWGSPADAPSPSGTPWESPADAPSPSGTPWESADADPYGPPAAADPYAPASADPYAPAGAQPGMPDAAAPPPYGQEGSPQPAWEGAPAGPSYSGGEPYLGGQPYPGAQPDPGEQPYPGWQPPPGGPREVPRIRPVHGQQQVDELATALHILVPIRSWLHDPGWRQFVRLLVIPYGLLPLVFIALFASSNDLSTPGWAYSLYIAPLWAIVFWLLIRPGPVERREIGIAAGSIVFVLIWIHIVTININGLMGKAGRPLSFPGAIGVGINEEITKALPIFVAAILLLRMRQTKLDVRMWMFLGTLVGLAFGVTEQAGYTSLDIAGIAHAQGNSQAIVEVLAFAERVFVDGFQHAMWAGISAFFIGLAINYPRRRIQLIAFGIAVPAVLHALYDWSAGAFASLWVPILVQALSLFLFLGYTMSAAAIERQVRQTPMFRGESMIMERIRDQQPSEDRRAPS
jgi:RsiW-degrading membrane proteinase PrsW (M82 family)